MIHKVFSRKIRCEGTYLVGVQIHQGKNVIIFSIPYSDVETTSRWGFSHVEKYSGFGDAIKPVVDDNFQMFRRYQGAAAFGHLQDLDIHPFLSDKSRVDSSESIAGLTDGRY